jgi:hypothetical protein
MLDMADFPVGTFSGSIDNHPCEQEFSSANPVINDLPRGVDRSDAIKGTVDR